MNELKVNLENLTDVERKQLTSLLEKAQQPKKVGTWFPKHGEEYWFASGQGPFAKIFNNTNLDSGIFTIQDPCKTEEEAKLKYERNKALIEVNRQVRDIIATEHPDWMCDWNNKNQLKWFPFYSYHKREVRIVSCENARDNFLFEHAPEGVWERIDKQLIKKAMGV